MDDLYDNLENYQDENIIDELKNENKDLKTKLEEYSSAMIRLQNDFDKLNSEYKKLEMNYSSLLKTARAEIERKSEMIKSLNSEKDLLVIKTLQNSGINILNSRRHMHDTQRPNKSYEINTHCIGKPQPEPQSGNHKEEKTRRNDRVNLLSCNRSEDTTSSLETKSNFSEDKELKDANFRNKTDKSKNNKTKEINKDVLMQCHKTKGEKIYNRRKSMPMCSRIEPIFSSDDDFEALNLKNIRKSPLKDDTRHYRKYSNRDNSFRQYGNKTSRFTDHDKYRRDRYESDSKYARQSPEKYRSKNIIERSETHKLRGDYKKSQQRVLRSPPTDKYNRSKSRDRRNFDRETYYDKQTQSLHNIDHTAVKHKIGNDLEEPSSKRKKTELIKKCKVEENIYNNDREKELALRSSFTKQQDFIEPTSCQSPDYIINDSTIPQHVAKEIKQTAITPLEDPRVTSNKYVIKSNKEKVLSTVVSEHISVRPINVTMWDMPNIEKFMIPPTLNTKKLPVETDDHFVDEIYMDIENPLLNDTLESGEIQEESYTDSKENNLDKMYGNEENQNKDQIGKLNSLRMNDSVKTKDPVIKKYKIPKIKTPDEISTGAKHSDQLSKKLISTSNYCNENQEGELEKRSKDTLSQPTLISDVNITSDIECKHNEMIKTNSTTMLSEETLVPVCTLADDLELSDEASDSKYLQKDEKKSIKTLIKDKTSINKKLSHVSSKKVQKDRDSGKTRKNKNKIDYKEESCTKAKEKYQELQTVSKLKEKLSTVVMSTQTKNKLSDLFGDSSSLITPDDLGLPLPDIQVPLTNKYVSIFENTENAVDLSVEDINRVQTNTNKSCDVQSNNKTVIEKSGNDGENTLVSKDIHDSTTANKSMNSLYENATVNDASEIVKTVIISTGVQPNYTKDNNTLQNSQKKCIEHTDTVNNDKVDVTSCMINNIKALATSTPHKPELEYIAPTATPDLNVQNDTCKIIEKTDLSSNVSNSSNPDEILNEADVPDVRIFVRRRRKIIKKP